MSGRGYRDIYNAAEEHEVLLDGVRLPFGADGVLHDPTPAQEAALTKDHNRKARFAAVEPPRPPVAPTVAKATQPDAVPVAGRDFVDAAVGKK